MKINNIRSFGRLFTPIVLCFTLFLALAPIEWATAQSYGLYAGVTRVNITPPVGYDHYRGTSTGVKDSLYAKAVVLHDGNEKAALVLCDLIRITRELSTEVRLMASEQTGIPYDNIIIAATHTHTGPAYRFEMREYVRKKRNGELTAEDKGSYPEVLIERVTQAIVDASNAAQIVEVRSGSGKAEGISFNRRFIMADGRVRFNPGVGNPRAIRPTGPIDPEVSILLFLGKQHTLPLAGLTVFANHTDTVGGTEFSADYPYYLARALRAVWGEEFISLFGQGTSGNINHIDVVEARHREGPESVTQRIGETLAEVVTQETPNLISIEQPRLAVRSEFVYAPLQQYTREELKWAHQEEDREATYNERAFLQNVRARKIRSLEYLRNSGAAVPPTIGEGPWTLPLEVQVIRIGEDAAIVGLPGEVFVELGLAIKESSPFRTTLVVEMTNVNISYVPDRQSFSQGAYETINTRIAPGGGEMLVETALNMLKEMKAL